jgi:NNP family nitrate/nitrite transporter-like MFS transporter
MLAILARERLAWVLSAFYFLTFGGFVAFSIYLPALLRDNFELTAADAGFRAAGFVLLATGMRPLGGWLSDRIGGARVLSIVFFGVAPFALLLAWPSMPPFTVGALGCAALLGAGNGAVFKLVPQYFPAETGTVTGLVGRDRRTRRFLPSAVAWNLARATGRYLAGLRVAGVDLACAGNRERASLSAARGCSELDQHFPQAAKLLLRLLLYPSGKRL